MFEDVAQMEKEIETFRKNVVASSQLVEGIAELTEATKKHKETYSAATAELLKKVDACIAEIKADHETALRTLSSNNDSAISTLQQNMAAEQQVRMAELQQIKTALESCQSETTKKTDEQISRLIAECERLLAEMKASQESQNTSYSEATAEVLKKVDACIAEIKADHEAALRTLSSNNDSAISTLQKNMSAEQQARMAELQQIKTALESCQAETTKKTDEQIHQLTSECERLISEMKTTLSAQQTAYAEKLQQTEQVIRGYQSEAEKKYNEFVSRLESTNVDQIFKEVQDLKQSVQTKFMILMGGIGATLIVAILGLILK